MKVDLATLETIADVEAGRPSIQLRTCTFLAIIAELRAGRELVDNLEVATTPAIPAESSLVLVRGAMRGYRKATKDPG